jgi:hypothetical protein
MHLSFAKEQPSRVAEIGIRRFQKGDAAAFEGSTKNGSHRFFVSSRGAHARRSAVNDPGLGRQDVLRDGRGTMRRLQKRRKRCERKLSIVPSARGPPAQSISIERSACGS